MLVCFAFLVIPILCSDFSPSELLVEAGIIGVEEPVVGLGLLGGLEGVGVWNDCREVMGDGLFGAGV